MQQLDYSMLFQQPPVAQQIGNAAVQYQQMQGQQIAQQKAQQEMEMQAAQAARVQEYLGALQSAESPQAMAKLAQQYPEQLEQLKGIAGFQSELQAEAVGEVAMNLSNLATTNPEAAQAYLLENAEVLRTMGPGYEPEALLERLQTDPAGFAKQADMMGVISLGPEKAQEILGQREGREVTRRGQDITMRGQEVTMRGQDITAQGQRISQQNALMAANSRIEAARLRQQDAGFPDLSVNMEKTLDGAITKATESEAAAARLDSLAEQFQATNLSGGKRGQIEEFFKEATGEEDFKSGLRKQFVQLKNERVINNLPPGVASDRDIEIFMAGYPKDFANKDYVTSFMRGMAKAERAKADLNNFKAEWISQNGNPGQNKKPFEYNGVPIEPGVSLKRAYDQYVEINPPFQVATPGFGGGTGGASLEQMSTDELIDAAFGGGR